MSEHGREILAAYLDAVTSDRQAIAQVAGDADQAIAEARAHLDDMLGHLGYLDEPDHVMAGSLFACAAMLALYLALKDRGMDVHEFGRKVLEQVQVQQQSPASRDLPPAIADAARQSQGNATAGEFVFEAVPGDGDGFDWGMNITSCAICSLYSRYDAMDLVPYMCASDDVVSDLAGQGLMRTGTIALGAGHCDFRFKRGEPGHHLAVQYPEKIRVVDQS